jgi:hypothetical protein
MEDDAAAAEDGAGEGADAGAAAGPSQLPEVELYMYLLVLIHLLDRKHFAQVGGASCLCRGGGALSAYVLALLTYLLC